MLENRSLNTACCGSCRSRLSTWFIGVTLFLVALAGGAILGAFFPTFFTTNVVAIAIFAIILLIAAIFAIILRYCRCNGNN